MDLPRLLEDLGPDLYQDNAFAVTGLGVDATARDIRRLNERARVLERVGGSAAGNGGAAAPLLPFLRRPEPTERQAAVQRLRDPVRRLVDEFFWFWPTAEGGPDPAIAALRRGDVDEAERIWSEQDTPTSAHNMAVLLHARALEGDGLDGRAWQRSLTWWRALLNDDGVWRLLEGRAHRLNDPRLQLDTARRFRAELSAALLSLNARLVVGALRDGRRSDAAQLLGSLRPVLRAQQTTLGPDLFEDALRRLLAPETARIRSLGETAEQQARSAPETADQVADRLLTDTAAPLGLLETALLPDHPALAGARDGIANQVLNCMIAYGNKTGDWTTAERLAERARQIAVTSATRSRVEENLEIVKGNLTFGRCWFCQERPPSEAHTFKQNMFGNVQYVPGYAGSTRVTWNHGTVEVPRCQECRSSHLYRAHIPTGGRGVLLVILAIIEVLLLVNGGPFFLTVAAIVAAVVVLLVPAKFGLPPAQRRHMEGFPVVKDRLAEGWQFGERPPGVN
ncbi:hypothetical protein [Actinomadura hibisca]|uniref:hypothetical protein n=1 Tax=Actinomadura hibisca TaxID=68565 RepID=UPI00082FDC7B|nr:hypothetical protein [Actinomadura hibisca]